jgi:hypothetical protein
MIRPVQALERREKTMRIGAKTRLVEYSSSGG